MAALARELVECFALNDRMNQMILERLDPRAWRAKEPGDRTRTIAGIFSHMHNVRLKWVRLSAPHLPLPTKLDRLRCTPEQVRAALAESAVRCCEMIEEALVNPAPRTAKFIRDGWARPWDAGAAMVAYMITHDAHHRGQVCLLAHQLGYPLGEQGAYDIWAWERMRAGKRGPAE